MSKDRIIQIVALAFAVTAVFGAGRILPTIVEKAGQEHLVLTVVDPTTGEPNDDSEVIDVFTSMVRSIETTMTFAGDDPALPGMGGVHQRSI